MYHLVHSAITDVGDRRESNQDSILALHDNFKHYSAGLFLVADGMGGLAHGEEISKYIAFQFERWWEADLSEIVSQKKLNNEDIGELLDQEIWDINNYALAFGQQVQSKVGSTLSLLLIIGDQYFIKNIGDSRIYLFRNRRFLQLTEDQSLVAQLVREKKLTPEEAKHYHKQNVLTMCIGAFQEPKSFTDHGRIKDGDQFLLCSDGLYHCLEKEEIATILSDCKMDQERKAHFLRRRIPSGMAKDNVSAIVVECKKKGFFK